MQLVRRAVLVSELKLAHDEATHLGEMVTVLEAARVLDDGRLRQLRLERVVANKRAMRLHEALRKLDDSRNEPNSTAVA